MVEGWVLGSWRRVGGGGGLVEEVVELVGGGGAGVLGRCRVGGGLVEG